MKKRLLISLALACCFAPLLSESQNLSINKIDALKNGARLIYVNENGDYLGCGIKLECMPFSVIMYSITFDKKAIYSPFAEMFLLMGFLKIRLLLAAYLFLLPSH